MLKAMGKAGYETWSRAELVQRILELEGAGRLGAPAVGAPAALGGPSGPGSAAPGPTRAAAAEGSNPASTDAPASASALGTPPRAAKKPKQMDFSKYSTRKVAIRFAYLGWNYHGLAFQKEAEPPTVEQQVLNALYKTRCIPSLVPTDCEFSRCGRTDRDVSAMAQVISLRLRSNLSVPEQADAANDARELDYLKMLNSHLPADILAYEICLRPPPDFDARFSCLWRHYRYYFYGSGLDVARMRAAAAQFVGEHDFRNFCRVDGSKQISNFKRTVLEIDIVPVPANTAGGGAAAAASGSPGGDLYYLSLRGTAFLWNQVRSIMAVLLLVGQGREPVETVAKLLDVAVTPRRPAYEIAWGVPLVLYDCGFAPMEWLPSAYTREDAVYAVWHEHAVKSTMARTMLDVVRPHAQPREALVNTGDGAGRRGRYVPVFHRQLLDPPEVVNDKWARKHPERLRPHGAGDDAE